jgi:hypothetical protein
VAWARGSRGRGRGGKGHTVVVRGWESRAMKLEAARSIVLYSIDSDGGLKASLKFLGFIFATCGSHWRMWRLLRNQEGAPHAFVLVPNVTMIPSVSYTVPLFLSLYHPVPSPPNASPPYNASVPSTSSFSAKNSRRLAASPLKSAATTAQTRPI